MKLVPSWLWVMITVWHCSNIICRINKVILCRALLVLVLRSVTAHETHKTGFLRSTWEFWELSTLLCDLWPLCLWCCEPVVDWLVATERWLVTSLQRTRRCRWIWSSAAMRTCRILLSWKQPRCSLWQHHPGNWSVAGKHQSEINISRLNCISVVTHVTAILSFFITCTNLTVSAGILVMSNQTIFMQVSVYSCGKIPW